ARVRGGTDGVATSDQVQEFQAALGAATEIARSDPAAQANLASSKVQFKSVRTELTHFARYKALHDCLHGLQLQLTAVDLAARTFPANPESVRALSALSDQLQRQARRARKCIPGLMTETDEVVWVDEFDQALTSVRAAVRSSAAETLTSAINALDRLL